MRWTMQKDCALMTNNCQLNLHQTGWSIPKTTKVSAHNCQLKNQQKNQCAATLATVIVDGAKAKAKAKGLYTNNKPAPNFPPRSPKKLPSSSTSLSPSSDVLCPHSLSSRSPSSAMTVAEGKNLAIRLETQVSSS